MIRALCNITRLVAIARTLARHDALEALEVLGVAPALVWIMRRRRRPAPEADGRLGVRLAAAAVALGPSFIKLGQALSTRADLLGPQVAEDLGRLRDAVPPFPAAEARARVARELGAPVDDLFKGFDDAPIAAASIAQVHFATTSDDREVAVKILRPGIEQAFARDIDLLLWIAQLIERTQPKWRRLRPVESVRAFAELVAIEMDLRLEGAAASELAENFRDDGSYAVPAVDWPRTGQRVLTTARVEGIPIHRRDDLIAAGHDPDAILATSARAMFNQIFRDGFFHGDPHPGNLFVAPDGTVTVVDFGIMGRLDRQSRLYIAELLLGFLTGDYARAAEVHFRAGFVPRDKSLGAFTQACRSIAEPILERPANEISIGRLLGQLFQITETFGMRTQPHLLLLQKVMVVAEGVGRDLSPEANMWLLARPLIEDWVRDNLGPQARLRDSLANFADAAHRLPRILAGAEGLLEQVSEQFSGAPARAARPPVWRDAVLVAAGAAIIAILATAMML
ncbi:MAG: 2-polyprenylphenol 6-hydroxylase [Alphaproteobacteria bacterium]|jgi:ubiquinone biosynthesis protein|nr:2-polyprenylphenol 6-hydroxylase [Alphaproteobacteria bacterium]MDP6516257.1 2-polyprenylphenol 6-hydroxylase [Alphaproteobacteria bacterium]